MNSLENYKALLERYFGNSTATFDAASGATNKVIGALNHTNFSSFHSTFLSRLKRLATRYSSANPNNRNLLQTLNEIATEKNWEGAYAEIVALDFLNSEQDWLSTPIQISKTVPASATLAGGFGSQNVNFDGYYDDFDVSFDIKILADKSRDILDGIMTEARTSLGIPNVVISPEYPLDLGFESFQQNRRKLLNELVQSIDVTARTSLVSSVIVPELKFRLMWQAGVLGTVGTYDPYQHAENQHTLLFKHAKKFSLVGPSLIVFVFFPWFSENVVTQFESSGTFYRAFCRRFFCQYNKDVTAANSLLKSFKGSETISQVTDKLSGVLFLEDTSIENSNPEDQNVKGFAYLNPNAKHKVSGQFREYLSSLRFNVDDMAHDNY